TPKAIVSQLAAEIATIIKMPDTRDKLLRQEHDPMILGPEEFAAFIRADMARVARIIKTANIKIES
ncbi:MAG: tripartite tricarboxylate transporter substrate binding protein, partial [Burkholderiales bacterium]